MCGARTGRRTICAADAPPRALVSVSPATGPTPLTVTADASTSTDTDATPIGTYTFNFGDGTAAVGPQAAPTVTHTYAAAGTYTVTVTVKDTASLASTATAQVVVKQNLVRNPGFETDLSGWNTSGSGTGITLVRATAGTHSGTGVAQLTNTTTAASTCLLNDSPNWVTTTAATTYTGSLWVRADTAGQTFKLRFR